MSSHLALVPVGSLDREILENLAPRLASRLPWPVVIREEILDPGSAFSSERGQFLSTRLLRLLDESVPPPAVRVLGVADLDLFIPVLTFVFGEARLGGRIAVTGMVRLRPENYGLPADPTRLGDRLLKEAMHEIGHTLSLVHCRDSSCVMASSVNADAVDHKSADYCHHCARSAGSAAGDDVLNTRC